MSKLKHTPGPWRFKREFVYDNGYPVYEKYYLSIGDRLLFIDSNGSPGENEQSANARLIAAAPEMIKTLTIRVVKELKNLGCFGDHCLECVVFYKCKFSLDKILIEKATGQKIEELI